MLEERLREAFALAEGGADRALRILLESAACAGARDIHLDPGPHGLDVLYSLDGVQHTRARIAPDRSGPFLARIKVLAGLPPDRNDLPQAGRIGPTDDTGRLGVSVSVFPTDLGEKAFLRFSLQDEQLDLDGLGLPEDIVAGLRRAVARPGGVVLLAGPAGSGKTTTLYALLHEIARSGPRRVVTIEDPIERALPGVTQTQVNFKKGLTFTASLRSLLPQKPQVILVGEIRDRETAQAVMEAGLAGSLVLSAIHAGTATEVVARLMDLDVEPRLLAGSLSAVLAQRLVRVRCPACGAGCEACHGTGYRGRRATAELLEASDPLREAVRSRAPLTQLDRIATAQGRVPLAQAGEALVREGTTTAEELRRILG